MSALLPRKPDVGIELPEDSIRKVELSHFVVFGIISYAIKRICGAKKN